MKVLLPTETTHTIILEPRFYPTTTIGIEIHDEATQVTVEPSITYTITSGVMSVTFDLTVAEGDRFQLKIVEGLNVVYRGKAFVTNQTPQDFKLTNNTYEYI